MNNSTTVKGKYLSGGAFFIFYYIHKIKIKYFLLNGEVFPTIIIKIYFRKYHFSTTPKVVNILLFYIIAH